MLPKLPPPSSGTPPSLYLRSLVSEESAAKARSFSLNLPSLISHRFMPQTSEMSIGAILPRKIEARKDETKEIRDVFRYSCGCFVLKRDIWGPVKRCDTSQPNRCLITGMNFVEQSKYCRCIRYLVKLRRICLHDGPCCLYSLPSRSRSQDVDRRCRTVLEC